MPWRLLYPIPSPQSPVPSPQNDLQLIHQDQSLKKLDCAITRLSELKYDRSFEQPDFPERSRRND
ncbi:MAG TPA: hypothetical protein V6D30_01520 [Leptolyngbyaceae cyanobacterium]